ncbi:hypothetical protein [Actinoplanes sp. NPDC023714]|uniref:hypothetical protein n=1 Tax=Actinoplanes sp. NPDC023714 TaxID=3154322 RepID=UPI0033CB016A
MTGTSRFRTATGTFVWAAVILVIAFWFFYMGAASETAWMENITDDGTGPAVATALITVPFLLVLLAVRLYLFRRERAGVVLGWAAALPVSAGLYMVAVSMLG